MRAPSCANAPKLGFQRKKKSSLPVISQANCFWSHWPGSNRPPARYECAALPDELQWHAQINKLIDRMMIFYYVKKLPSIRKFQFPGIFLKKQPTRSCFFTSIILFYYSCCFRSPSTSVAAHAAAIISKIASPRGVASPVLAPWPPIPP